MITINLPDLPPSTNNLYANVPGKGRVKSASYKAWLTKAGWLLKAQTMGRRIAGDVEITIEAGRVNARADVSNIAKPAEDLLVACGVIDDDRFVQAISARWRTEPGLTIVVTKC